MPVNKDALIRYRVINRRLKNKYKPYPSLEELIEACEDALGKEISKRSIQSDLQAMRSDSDLGFNAPIVYDKANAGYKYSDKNYSIDNIPLNEEDFKTLELATGILEQFKNVEILQPFSGIIEKIASSYRISRQAELKNQKEFIEFESLPPAKGTSFIGDLLQVIKDQKQIILYYQGFNHESEKKYKLHPYLLKEYRNRWYLIAWNVDKGMINTFGLDRIKSIENKEKYFEFDSSFNSTDYFRESFGITAPQKLKVKKVMLKFSRSQANYIISQPLHPSQKIIEKKSKSITIELNVMISYELKSQILSYGHSVEVLSPKNLKQEIIDELKNTLSNY